jgi:3-hydroxyacyl-CoA dehydrogenase/enoyl-CoA hydratase/3-hydroxybutyryl-CoA epimerase
MSNTNENNSAVNFTVENHESGVAIIWFNSPGKVNLLSQAALGELDVIVDRLAADKDCRGVVIASAKSRSYIAGADVNEIGQLQSLSAKASYDLTMNAKGILSKLSNLGVPTLALINGACKGGGLELALWCTFRIAIADGAVVMGLPEVKLGIIPGFGGSVLLPRLIDTVKAVTMIASGSDVTAAEAWKIGLVDEIVTQSGRQFGPGYCNLIGSKSIACCCQ